MCTKRFRRELAFLCALALLIVGVPIHVQAAVAPAFSETYTTFYENRANKGVYNITVKNVKKGYLLQWKISGPGKGYASFAAAQTTASATTASNKLTINSSGDMDYANAHRIRITVKVFTAKKKKLATLTFAGKLQSKAKDITIDSSNVYDLNSLTPGEIYNLKAELEPANSTSKVYWKVTDATGKEYPQDITDNGTWTPSVEGDYSIEVSAKNSAKGAVLCKDTLSVTVGNHMNSVTQTASNKLDVVFNTDASARYKLSDFTIKSGTASVIPTAVAYSEDGKTASLTTATNFIDGRTYEVSCGGAAKSFQASVGRPARVVITTTTAQVDKYTVIQYLLLDANGIDVTNTADGTVQYTSDVSNGMIDPVTNRLLMTTVGRTGTVTLLYTSADGTLRLTDTQIILCVAAQAEDAAVTHFTLTDGTSEPAYTGTDVRSIAIGETKYVHFRALDSNGQVISYDEVTYTSSDADALIVNGSRLTPIKTGTVNVIVTVRQGTASLTYSFPVTVAAERYLSDIQLKEQLISISNTNLPEYQKEVPVKAVDQYGNEMVLDSEIGTIMETGGKAVLASYDSVNNRMIIRAQGAVVGTYNYVLTVIQNGITLTKSFTVVVSTPVATGLVTYQIEAPDTTLNLAVDSGTPGSRSLQLRIGEYRDGVFLNYKSYNSASIRKDNRYYGNDLLTSSATPLTLGGGSVLTLTPMTILPSAEAGGIGTCTKAEPGVYTVTFTYLNQSYQMQTDSIDITITDDQRTPTYTIKSTSAPKTAATALELVNQCVELSNGTIISCTATGTAQTGSSIPLSAGESIHIDAITVQTVETLANGAKVYMNHTIKIDKTLKNG